MEDMMLHIYIGKDDLWFIEVDQTIVILAYKINLSYRRKARQEEPDDSPRGCHTPLSNMPP
jgi:hypothetical protein